MSTLQEGSGDCNEDSDIAGEDKGTKLNTLQEGSGDCNEDSDIVGEDKTGCISPITNDAPDEREKPDTQDKPKFDFIEEADLNSRRETTKSEIKPYRGHPPSISFTNVKEKFLDWGDFKEPNELNDDIIVNGLSDFSTCPLIHVKSMCKLRVSNKDLCEIDKLQDYDYLQYVDISHNVIEDLTPLEKLQFLIFLDASHNHIKRGIVFKAPLYLCYLNLSHNNIEYMEEMGSFWSLVQLNLSHNKIRSIAGVRHLRYLRYLDLSFNQIKSLKNLGELRLTHLLLQNNRISNSKLEAERTQLQEDFGREVEFPHFNYINLNNNAMKSLAFCKDIKSIICIHMINNKIIEPAEARYLVDLREMIEMDMNGNPIIYIPGFREILIAYLPSLILLNEILVLPEEKLQWSILNYSTEFENEQKKKTEKNRIVPIPEVLSSTDDLTIPLIILVGPVGSHKGLLVKKIAETFPEEIYAGRSHSSQNQKSDKVHGIDYYYASREIIDDMDFGGMFLTHLELLGNSYGFSCGELIYAIFKQRFCLTHMDWKAAKSFYNKGLRPYLILTICEELSTHKRRLRDRFQITEAELANVCQKRRSRSVTRRGKEPKAVLRRLVDVSVEAVSFESSSPRRAKAGQRRGKGDAPSKKRREEIEQIRKDIDAIISSRQDYLTLKRKYERLFDFVVYTDNLNEAYIDLREIFKKCYLPRLQAKPLLSEEHGEISAKEKQMRKYLEKVHKYLGFNEP